MAEYRLEMRGVSKSFPGVKALDKVNLKVRPGTVHALMGENGAGKSTLMKCLFGIYHMDEGEVFVDGEKVNIQNPDEALHKGLAMVHQELQPVPERTIAENMYLGRFPVKSFGPIKVIDHKTMNEEAKKWLENVKMPFDPRKKLGHLSISQMQSIEIAKAVSQEAKLIILDEPTVAVDPQSRNKILEGIQKLNRQGSTIIYTSHYMEEVEQICTRIAIMDHGRSIAVGTKEELKNMIKTGETITIEAVALEEQHLQAIRRIPHVFDLHYAEQVLTLRCTGAEHNLIRILNYLQEQHIPFGRVFSELPTLNDVFLEITGKQLRD